MSGIPKIIHQTWKSNKIPKEFQSYVHSWKKHNPDWEYKLWLNKDDRSFIETYYPWFLKQYNSYEHDIQRMDSFRYFLLFHYGGLYVDLDFECLKPFDSIINKHSCFFGQEPLVHANLMGKDRLLSNALMASAPRHKFWEHVFRTLEVKKNEPVLKSTGPALLEEAYSSYSNNHDIKIYPPNIFFPLVFFENPKVRLTFSDKEKKYYSDMFTNRTFPEESYAVHHWAGTWEKKSVLWKKIKVSVLERFKII